MNDIQKKVDKMIWEDESRPWLSDDQKLNNKDLIVALGIFFFILGLALL